MSINACGPTAALSAPPSPPPFPAAAHRNVTVVATGHADGAVMLHRLGEARGGHPLTGHDVYSLRHDLILYHLR